MLLCLEFPTPRLRKFWFGVVYLVSPRQSSSSTSTDYSTPTSDLAMSTSSSDSSPSLARSRWGLLQQAIIKKTIPEPVENPASKRVFERYCKIVSWTPKDASEQCMSVKVQVPLSTFMLRSSNNSNSNSNSADKNNRSRSPFLREYSCETGSGVILTDGISKIFMTKEAANQNFDNCTAVYTIQICRRNPILPVDIRNLKGFDKTGRICIWPSEQILTYWSLRNIGLFEEKKVIEIGGGFHCLAGLALAKYSTEMVVLTDGDAVNVDDVSYSLHQNEVPPDACRATSLRWGKSGMKPELKFQFDIVLAADVVYEVSTFTSLLETIWLLLKPGGKFILFNPTRDGMLKKFVKLAQSQGQSSDNDFGLEEVKWIEHYDPYVTDLTFELKKNNPAFNKDWHYPNQVIFKKKKQTLSGLETAKVNDWLISNDNE